MSQGNKLQFQRGAAANTEFEDRNKGAENIVTMTVTLLPARENLQSFSALWRFEQGQHCDCCVSCFRVTRAAIISCGRGSVRRGLPEQATSIFPPL